MRVIRFCGFLRVLRVLQAEFYDGQDYAAAAPPPAASLAAIAAAVPLTGARVLARALPAAPLRRPPKRANPSAQAAPRAAARRRCCALTHAWSERNPPNPSPVSAHP